MTPYRSAKSSFCTDIDVKCYSKFYKTYILKTKYVTFDATVTFIQDDSQFGEKLSLMVIILYSSF